MEEERLTETLGSEYILKLLKRFQDGDFLPEGLINTDRVVRLYVDMRPLYATPLISPSGKPILAIFVNEEELGKRVISKAFQENYILPILQQQPQESLEDRNLRIVSVIEDLIILMHADNVYVSKLLTNENEEPERLMLRQLVKSYDSPKQRWFFDVGAFLTEAKFSANSFRKYLNLYEGIRFFSITTADFKNVLRNLRDQFKLAKTEIHFVDAGSGAYVFENQSNGTVIKAFRGGLANSEDLYDYTTFFYNDETVAYGESEIQVLKVLMDSGLVPKVMKTIVDKDKGIFIEMEKIPFEKGEIGTLSLLFRIKEALNISRILKKYDLFPEDVEFVYDRVQKKVRIVDLGGMIKDSSRREIGARRDIFDQVAFHLEIPPYVNGVVRILQSSLGKFQS